MIAKAPILILRLLIEASINIIRIKRAIGNNAYGQTNALNNRNITPRVNNAGNTCTGFNDSGYFLYKLIRAMPELCTCLKNFFRSVRRLWYTQASGKSLHLYPPLKIRILKSISSPNRILEKPPSASYTSRLTPILKLRG